MTDALSRYSVRDHNDEKVNGISLLSPLAVGDYQEPEVWPDDTLCAIAGYQPPVSYTDILASTSADKGMVKLRTLVIAGFPNTNAELQKDLQQYWRVRDMLSEHGGVIYSGDRVVVPEMFRERILNTCNF